MRIHRLFYALACTTFLAGCPRQALFVVLPDAEGGGTGAITIDDGKSVTTFDFVAVASEVAGHDLSAFMQPWLYGSAVPQYP